MRPSLGRIVVYRLPAGQIPPHGQCDHAAIVAGVNYDGTVNLHVFPNLAAPFFAANVGELAPSIASSVPTWHWPPRVEEAPGKPMGEKR
jgi:hypothetical protein